MNEIGQNTKFLIVGLGLMGGSYAEALSSKGFTVNAITKDQESVDYALKRGIINEGSVKIDPKLIKEADIIIFALYPHVLIEWI
ncbi:MAG: prephenate dehydrogenase, partial [Clostridiales bacterium]|nr:prephenate dehydrogenase [Clostridiales bacterium]